MRRGFTLVEILVATLLLSLSLIAMTRLWSVSRRMTERSRDTAEYYAIARQEAERFRTSAGATVVRTGFEYLFNSTNAYYNTNTGVSTPSTTYYDQYGNSLGSSTTGAFYRAVSTIKLVETNATTTASLQKLGVQTIQVYTVSDSSLVLETTMFFAWGGA